MRVAIVGSHGTGKSTLVSMRVVSRFIFFDHVFYTPIEFELEDDGTRFTSPDLQRHIDEIILQILDRFGVDYITLSGSVDERLEKMYDVLG